MGFEEVEHTADKALRVFGNDLTELFLSAATGLTHLMAADVSEISTEIEKPIELKNSGSKRQPPPIYRQRSSEGKHPCLKNRSRR